MKFVGKLAGNLFVYFGPDPPKKRTKMNETTKNIKTTNTDTIKHVFHQGLPEIS